MPKPGRGVVYCVNNATHYRAMLAFSLRSLRRFHPDWPVEVIQLGTTTDWYDTVRWHLGGRIEAFLRKLTRATDAKQRSRHQAMAEKIRLYRDPPFEQTLFMDCDTVVLKPLSDVFDRLTGPVDVVVQASTEGVMYHPHPPFTHVAFRQFNSGVVVFNQRFAEAFAAVVADCTLNISDLADQDQYVFSETIRRLEPGRLAEHPTLQIDNDAPARRRLKIDDVAELTKKVCTSPAEFGVYHYIFNKKPCLKAAQKAMALV